MKTAVIVGAGLSGATAAALLTEAGYQVEVFETRLHIAGNCYDHEQHGLLVHRYGPHVFHTSNPEVRDFVKKYADWQDTRMEVTAEIIINGRALRVPVPFNIDSREIVEKAIGCSLVSPTLDQFVRNHIFRTYSEKMWGMPFDRIPRSITNRVKTYRDSRFAGYHENDFVAIPVGGYTKFIETMLSGATVHTGCGADDWREPASKATLVVYTGSPDAFWNYQYGRLDYRSIRFHQHEGRRTDFQQLNHCNTQPHYARITRTIDYANLLHQQGDRTVTVNEEPVAYDPEDPDLQPMYPMLAFGENTDRFNRYKELTAACCPTNVLFTGRLARYAYQDMDVAVTMAMRAVKERIFHISNCS